MDDDFGYGRIKAKSTGGSVKGQLQIFIIVIALVVLGWFVYKNYIMVKSGDMERLEKLAKKSKRNKQYWDASEIG